MGHYLSETEPVDLARVERAKATVREKMRRERERDAEVRLHLQTITDKEMLAELLRRAYRKASV